MTTFAFQPDFQNRLDLRVNANIVLRCAFRLRSNCQRCLVSSSQGYRKPEGSGLCIVISSRLEPIAGFIRACQSCNA